MDLPGALAAFVVPKAVVTAEEVHNFASQRLQSVAVPRVIFTDHLPTIIGGKLDYIRLANMAATQIATPDHSPSPKPPQPSDDVCSWLVAQWRDLLENSTLEAESNFFLAGGDSLLAIKLIAQIKKHFDIDLPLMAVMNNQTPRSLSAALRVAIGSSLQARTKHG
jgi:acyl carrier protein